jgi:hypothetical protein
MLEQLPLWIYIATNSTYDIEENHFTAQNQTLQESALRLDPSAKASCRHSLLLQGWRQIAPLPIPLANMCLVHYMS